MVTADTPSDGRLLDDAEALRVALDAGGIGLWSWDPHTDRLRWSHEIAQILGAELETFAAFAPLVDPEDLPRAQEQIAEVLAGRRDAIAHTVRFRRPDGPRIWVQSQGKAIRDADGRVVRVVGTIVDVSAAKRAEESAMAAARVETIGRLAGGVAHDFNNLLTAILGYAELIERAVPRGTPVASMIVSLQDAATKGAQLTAQLLAFARKQVVRPQVIDVNERVRRVLDLVRRLIGEHIEIVTELAPDVGRVRIDPGQFEQILINLAVNARDAMPRGGRLVLATATREVGPGDPGGMRPGGYVVVAVTDTGEGIGAGDLARVFEPFFTTKGQGTGLGLATCHQIVSDHGGRIVARSEAGHGTTVEFALPRVAAPADDAAPAPRRAASGGHETILLVEDEPAIRALVASYLVGLGYRVLPAEDGLAGLGVAAREARIDAVVSDVVMPRLGGPDLVRRLLRDRPRLRVLFTSGYDADQLDQGEFPGAAVLDKPYQLNELGERLRRLFDAR